MTTVRAIFVNLPVAELPRSMEFFEALGYSFSPQFTNKQAAALVISDTIYAMLHTPESFRRFTTKQIGQPGSPRTSTRTGTIPDELYPDTNYPGSQTHL